MLTGNEPIQTRDGNSDADILEQARKRAKKGEEAWSYNYDESKKDVEFLAGNQWYAKEKALRENEGRPALTLNQLPKFLDQVLGDQRQNRPSISIHPIDSQASQQVQSINGGEYTLAEVYEGLIKNIEYTCGAEMAYDTAFQHAVESGFGWLRVLTDYSEIDAFDQDIKIKAIRDRYSVLIDPRTQEPDGSDMNWAFITELISKDEFEKRYPNAMVGELTSNNGWWLQDDSVRVAEYFVREPVTRELLLLTDGRAVWKDEVKDVLDELAQQGITVTRSRKVKTYKVKWYKITAWEILEGPVDWAGSTIPLIPVYGKNIMVNGQPIYMGLIRHAKDAQRMHNYWMTTVTERVALAPKAPWVGPASAFENYEQFWNEANRKNLAYLPYNDRASTPPQRVAPPPMPTAEIQMAMQAVDEIKNTIGMFDASLGRQGNETSGRAILARQKEGDTGTFAFVDNLSRAIRRVGKILIELIPQIYDAERIVRVRFRDGTGDNIQINTPIIDEQTGKTILVHDIAVGKYDVVVTTGPSYNTQRMEAAASLMQFVQAVPQAGQVAMDLIAQNMDWPMADELAARLKKILPAGILSPEEAQQLNIQPQQQQVDPAVMLKQQEMQMQMQIQAMKLETERIKAMATGSKAQAEIQSSHNKQVAEQNRMMAEASKPQEQTGIDPRQIEALVRDAVARALAEYEQGV